MSKRTNAGYEIIETISLPNEEYVLGVRTTTFNEQAYVTWVYVDGTYYYGHYLNEYDVALKDLYERAKNELEWRIEKLSQKLRIRSANETEY